MCTVNEYSLCSIRFSSVGSSLMTDINRIQQVKGSKKYNTYNKSIAIVLHDIV